MHRRIEESNLEDPKAWVVKQQESSKAFKKTLEMKAKIAKKKLARAA